MKINKADLMFDGDKVRLTMPLTKVDTEKRIVSGWASLDNVDSQKDVILAEANRKAFSGFRGNIREMHQPVAVGKMVNFVEDVFFDSDGKAYNGIYVDVYVSKGASDTWEKVLDGTLTGFSIGGNILDAESVFDKAAGSSVRIVKDYELVELSLVDSPANQLANVLSVHKTAAGVFMDGMIAKSNSESVFYCKEDDIAKTSNDETVSCPAGHKMENIGWIEYDDDLTKSEKIKEAVEKHNSSHDEPEQELPATNQGGVDVAEEKDTVEPGSPVPAEVPVAEEGKAETEVASSVEEVEAPVEEDTATEKAADVSEVEVEEPDFEKMFEKFTSTLEAGLTKTREEVSADVTKAVETFDSRVTELATKYDDLVAKFDGLTEELATVNKAVETVDGKTATKKSNDLGGSEDTLEKATSTGSSKGEWGGSFLPRGGKRFLSVSDMEN